LGGGGGGKNFIVKNCPKTNISLGYFFPMHENYIQPTSLINWCQFVGTICEFQINCDLKISIIYCWEIWDGVLNKTNKTLKSYHFKHEGQFP
jgi:hypothetical protein